MVRDFFRNDIYIVENIEIIDSTNYAEQNNQIVTKPIQKKINVEKKIIKETAKTIQIKKAASSKQLQKKITEQNNTKEKTPTKIETNKSINFKEIAQNRSKDKILLLSQMQLSNVVNQISSCWELPVVNEKKLKGLKIVIKIFISSERKILNAQIIKDRSSVEHEYFAVASKNALEALKDPRCEKINLPSDIKFHGTKEIILIFCDK